MARGTAETVRAAQGAAARGDLRDRLRSKRPQRAEHSIVLDPGPVDELTAASDALSRARLFDQDVEAAEQRVEQAREAAADAVVTLTLQALPRPEYEQLLLAHPPTRQQAEEKQTYNVDTFAPALVAACVVDPDTGERPLSEQDVAELFAEWNQGEVAGLWQRAVQVCTQARNVALPFVSGTTRG